MKYFRLCKQNKRLILPYLHFSLFSAHVTILTENLSDNNLSNLYLMNYFLIMLKVKEDRKIVFVILKDFYFLIICRLN